jgi:uncharacterized protein (DUF58 family)
VQSPSPDAARLASVYRPRLPETATRQRTGDRLGKGTGVSLEFQDRRAYAPGDDVRHLDWRAYARTDQLFVRLYREEVQPRLEVLLDASRSMAVEAAKARLGLDLAAMLTLAARDDGLAVRVLLLGARAGVLEPETFRDGGVDFDGARPLGESIEEAAGLVRPGAVRFLVSDFLSPHEAPSLVRTLAARAGALALVQVLGEGDLDPPEGSALRLTDAETGGTLDLVLDPRTVRAYRDRLARLSGALETECRRVGAAFVSITASEPLDGACRDRLVPAGVLEPR